MATGLGARRMRLPQKKWGPASLPAPTAPSEGSAGVSRPGSRKTRFTSPGSPAQASLPIVETPAGHLSDVQRPFLGRPLFASRFAFRDPKTASSRVALEEDRLFRRLFPAGPANSRGKLSLPAGGDRSFRHPPLPSCRCRPSGGGGDFRPDHLLTMHSRAESGKRKMRVEACG